MTGGFIPSLNSGVLYLFISLFQVKIMTSGFIPSLNSGVLYLLISLFQVKT